FLPFLLPCRSDPGCLSVRPPAAGCRGANVGVMLAERGRRADLEIRLAPKGERRAHRPEETGFGMFGLGNDSQMPGLRIVQSLVRVIGGGEGHFMPLQLGAPVRTRPRPEDRR